MPTNAAHDIDSAWLTEALGETVEVVRSSPVAVGVGLLASVHRVELLDGRCLYVKLPSSDPRTRSIAQHFGYYAREAGTYRWLLANTDLRTPRCRAVVDSDRGPIVILDELADHHAADQLVGADPSQALAATDLLGDLHARFWNAPVLAACPWLPGPSDAAITMYEHLFATTWPSFCTLMADVVPAKHLRAAEQVIDAFSRVCASFAHAPRTLVHGDFRLDNLMFAPDGSAGVLDWQLAAWGRGAYDLAFFASGSIRDDLVAELEPQLVGRYHARLLARGVEHYDLDACWHDYLGGLVLNLPNPVTALVAVPPGNERGARLLSENARRALATVARHAASLSSW